MAGHLLAKQVTTVSVGRDAPRFINQTHIGWQKISNSSLLHDRLSTSVYAEEVEADTGLLDYELSTVI